MVASARYCLLGYCTCARTRAPYLCRCMLASRAHACMRCFTAAARTPSAHSVASYARSPLRRSSPPREFSYARLVSARAHTHMKTAFPEARARRHVHHTFEEAHSGLDVHDDDIPLSALRTLERVCCQATARTDTHATSYCLRARIQRLYGSGPQYLDVQGASSRVDSTRAQTPARTLRDQTCRQE